LKSEFYFRFPSDLLSSASDSGAADSHKNEGFLKSVWQKFTDNPTHAKDEPIDKSSKLDEKAPKSEKDPKKENKSDKSFGTNA